jgi:hypothetical protein
MNLLRRWTTCQLQSSEDLTSDSFGFPAQPDRCFPSGTFFRSLSSNGRPSSRVGAATCQACHGLFATDISHALLPSSLSPSPRRIGNPRCYAISWGLWLFNRYISVTYRIGRRCSVYLNCAISCTAVVPPSKKSFLCFRSCACHREC